MNVASFMARSPLGSDPVRTLTVEVAGPESFEVERDVTETDGPHGGHDVGAPGDRVEQPVGLHLDARRLAVVAHPHLVEPEPMQGRLRPIDLAEQSDAHGRAVRDAAGE